MFALVRFDNESYYICKKKDIEKKKSETIVRYKGSRFAAECIAEDDVKEKLKGLKAKLEAERERQSEESNDAEDNSCENLKDDGLEKKSTEPSQPLLKTNEDTSIKKEEIVPLIISPSNSGHDLGKNFDRDLEKNLDRDFEKNSYHDSEKNTDCDLKKISDHDSGNNSDHELEKNSDHDSGENSDHELEKNSDHDSGKNSDHELEKILDRDLEKNSDPDSEKNSDYDLGKNSDHDSEKNSDYDLKKNSDQNLEKNSDHDSDKNFDHDLEKNYDQVLENKNCGIQLSETVDQALHINEILGCSGVNSEGFSEVKRRKLPVIVQDEIINLNEILQRAISYSLPSTDEKELDEGIEGADLNGSLSDTARVLFDTRTSVWGNFPDVQENDIPTLQSFSDLLNLSDVRSISEIHSEVAGSSESSVPLPPCPTKISPIQKENKAQPDGTPESDDDGGDNYSCGDSEYVPETDNSTDSEQEENEIIVNSRALKDTSADVNLSTNSSIHILSHSFNTVGRSAPDDDKMFVKNSESGLKRDYCPYCNTEQAKLSRHVVRKHMQETDVAEFLSFDRGADERKKIMTRIRKKGYFAFNSNPDLNTGEKKVMRRPNARFEKEATDYALCPSCFAEYSKKTLHKHRRRCLNRKNKSKRRDGMVKSKEAAGRIHHVASNVLRQKVFPTMKEDEVVKAIRYDELIIRFANQLCKRYKDPHYYDLIRQKMRQLGRFLIEARKENPNIHDMFSVYTPKNYDSVISAVQTVTGLNESQTGLEKPSLASSLGTLLKTVGQLCVSVCIKRENKNQQTNVEDFLKLLGQDFSTSVARTALEAHIRRQRQKKVILPSADDIQKLQLYLRNEVRKNYNALLQKFSYKNWIEMMSSALSLLQLFNRRRPGETERILIDDFKNYQKITDPNAGDPHKNFTSEEKKAAQKYVRFEIRGKLNRTVPVLAHVELITYIEYALALRAKAGVDENNPYVFGIPGHLKGDFKYLRACVLMRRYAVECGAERPQTLRGTILRKHVATMCMYYNLPDHEVDRLVNFMGHAKAIHKDYYRKPDIEHEILVISKLLENVQGREDDESDGEIDSDVEAQGAQDNTNEGTNLSQAASDDESLPVPSTSIGIDKKTNDSTKKRRTRSISPAGKCKRLRWTEEEKKVAFCAFQQNIDSRKLPSFKEIQSVMAEHPELSNRTVATVKTWVSNQIKKA